MSYTARLETALGYARVVHAAQLRKGTSLPYLTHLMSVAALVAEHGGTEDQVIAGLLHDSAEDQGGQARLDDVRQSFGEGVAAIVLALSDSLEGDASRKASWRERKEAYIAAIPHKPASAHLVAACDKLHNLGSMLADYHVDGLASFGRFKQGLDGQCWYHRAVTEAIERTGVLQQSRAARVLARLHAAVTALEAIPRA